MVFCLFVFVIGLDEKFTENVFFFVQNNRNHMTRDAKQAARLEKKLKILLGGYQVCSPFGVDLVHL